MSEAAANYHFFAERLADALALVFAAAAVLHLAAPDFLLRTYRQWGYGHGFHYAVGMALALTALFLAIAETRVWGGILGAMILFFTVTSLLHRERYLYAIPAILLMIALAPAMA